MTGGNDVYKWCEGRWRCPQELDAPFCDWAWGFERRSVRTAVENAEAAPTRSQHSDFRIDALTETQERVATTFYFNEGDDIRPLMFFVAPAATKEQVHSLIEAIHKALNDIIADN